MSIAQTKLRPKRLPASERALALFSQHPGIVGRHGGGSLVRHGRSTNILGPPRTYVFLRSVRFPRVDNVRQSVEVPFESSITFNECLSCGRMGAQRLIEPTLALVDAIDQGDKRRANQS